MTPGRSRALSPAQWAQVRDWFGQLAPLDAGDRDAQLCAAHLDAAVDAELRSLLAHAGDERADLAPAPPPGTQFATGQSLGAWRVGQRLGTGGMGEVWRARRADGAYDGDAAIKVLKRGMDSAALLARFGQEQRALARLNHPHIARLFDAGLTPDQRPYFVMELVEGQPIDQAVNGLPLLARLRLFLQLADAVAHAHRHLLVHRDLKPSNVLVDADGQVKLLDFGIAKALDPLEGGDASQTLAGERPFTPHYASPEQVRGEPVGTATDVYSLGVLLYELLTGVRPTGRQARTPTEAVKGVLEEEPMRPSRLPSTEAPDRQGTIVRALLAGDLDHVLLKALDKSVERRYASVDAMASDVRAFIEGRPVSARAAGPGYVLGKFVRRNRWAVLAGAVGSTGLVAGLAATLLQGQVVLALGAVGLTAGLVLALVQARRAQLARDEVTQARDEAQRHLSEMRRLANSMVFEVNDALESGPTEGRKQLVRAAAQSLERQATMAELSGAERIELAQALDRLARIEGHEFTNNLGNVQDALTLYDRALQVLQPLHSRNDDNPQWHGAMYSALEGRAAALRWTRRLPEALSCIERAAQHAARAAALAPAEIRWRHCECIAHIELSGHHYKAARNTGLNHLDAAQAAAEQALQSSQRLVAQAADDPQAWRLRATVLRMHAGLLAIGGRLQDGVAAERRAFTALERAMALPGGEQVRLHDFVVGCIHVSLTLQTVGLNQEAQAATDLAVAHAEHCHRADPNNEWTQRQVFAVVQVALDLYLRTGQAHLGNALYERAMAALGAVPNRRDIDGWFWNHAWADALQAMCWVRSGEVERAEQAVELLRQWLRDGQLKLREHTGPMDAELEAHIHAAVAYVEAARGRLPQAAVAARAACERLDAMLAARDRRDVAERLIAMQDLVRLAQAPFGDAPAGAALRAEIVVRARGLDDALIAGGILAPDQRGESRWLAEQARQP